MKKYRKTLVWAPLAIASVAFLSAPVMAKEIRPVQAAEQRGAVTAAPTPANYGDAPVGFYQIVQDQGKVYVAFGGTLENYMTNPVKQPEGTVPGAVFVFDAQTLDLKEEIPLEAIAGALALNAKTQQLFVGHTYNHALSTIDLRTHAASHHVLDTHLAGREFRIRYLASDDAGDVYVSAFDWNDPFQHAIFKYSASGERDAKFTSTAYDGLAIPVSITSRLNANGHPQVLFGGSTLRLANAQTGALEYVSAKTVQGSANAQVNLYNYIDGPRGSLIATNAPNFMDGNQGDHNLYLFEKGREDQAQTLFTAATALEVIYNPKAEQLYASSYGNQLLSIVALPEAAGLESARFENIRFAQGIPSNLAVRERVDGTDIFVTLRTTANQVAKVSIAGQVKGIEGLRAQGACTVTVWDLSTRTVQAPQPCDFVDVAQQLKENLESAQKFAQNAPAQVAQAQAAEQASEAAFAQAQAAFAQHPLDAAVRSERDQAKFAHQLAVFMLVHARKSASQAQHVAQGAQAFLTQWQNQQMLAQPQTP